jgi:hypothetical protein
MRIPANALKHLARDKGARFVSLDEPLGAASTPAESLPAGLNVSFPELVNLPYTGAGVGVAVIDSGYKGRSDLKNSTVHKESLITGNSDITDRSIRRR